MRLSDACEKVGGQVIDNNVCRIGSNIVKQLDPFHYEIVTPRTTVKVRASTVRLTDEGLLFPFNNCGVEVTPRHLNVKCFAPGRDNDLNLYIEEVFNAVI